ncbi:TetR/AcrR family transcriptional regulator C-terminal domain-containing protein [Kribbella sp.]|uniref:TetR/AcrR family transcriptional regulator C-terminal domain-containing protein n=1 Tax=Kribbella sp. TaxID=1871183 RepID=UPI002D4E49E4|nr:TetR/AcrR family transcriptional regulator C-terminal domain-containing protein [Kribbella sp.]HZX02560.1 TetR/AcrR family transcriptional regulator C-terminal domain-containing protein [Kribbella sp.]
MRETIWTRERKAAPARETLSREQIVATAMRLLDAEGVAGLSMRKLAAKLDAGATSLYWHVPTKDDLIDLLIDEVWGEIDVPEPDLAGWRSGALLFGHSLRSAVLRHPWLPEVMYTRPSVGPNAMKLGERGLVLFGAAGFSDQEVDLAMGSVMSYVLGTVSAEVATREMVRKSGSSEERWVSELLEQAEARSTDYPAMQQSVRRRIVTDLDTGLTNNFVFGLDALLDGLQTRVKK